MMWMEAQASEIIGFSLDTDTPVTLCPPIPGSRSEWTNLVVWYEFLL